MDVNRTFSSRVCAVNICGKRATSGKSLEQGPWVAQASCDQDRNVSRQAAIVVMVQAVVLAILHNGCGRQMVTANGR